MKVLSSANRRRSARCAVPCLPVALLLLLAHPAATLASQVRLSVQQLTDQSQVILTGRVVSTRAHIEDDERGRHIYTTVTIRPGTVVKGLVTTPELTLDVVGGTYDGVTEAVNFSPVFRNGEEVVLFVAGDPPALVGARQGKLTVVNGRVFADGGWVTVPNLVAGLQRFLASPASGLVFDRDTPSAQRPGSGPTVVRSGQMAMPSLVKKSPSSDGAFVIKGGGQLPPGVARPPSVARPPARVNAAAAAAAVIDDAFWLNQIDSDGDGYKSSADLVWDPNVEGEGSLEIFEKVYGKPASSATWTLLLTTAAHTITGVVTDDWQFLTLSTSARDLYDLRIEVYRSGQTTPDDVRSDAIDPDLNDYAMEPASEDGATGATIYDAAWTTEVDSDGDGYKRSALLYWDPDVASGTGSLLVYEEVFWKPAGSTTWNLLKVTESHTITGTSSTDVQYVEVAGMPAHDLYDWKIVLFRDFEIAPDYTRSDANDADLNDYAMESVAEDGGTSGSAPFIGNITPGKASAGTWTPVTITGSNFGATQGSSKVEFFYTEDTPIGAPIQSWSDTTIVCTVPTDTINNYSASAGSGPVTVTTAGGTSNGFPFRVTFSYKGSHYPITPGGTVVGYLLNENDPTITGEAAAVNRAAATWNAEGSGFAFRYDGTHTGTTSSRNNTNEIMWGSIGTGGVLAASYYWIVAGVMTENDIVFNTAYQWSTSDVPAAGKYDVETIALHELGHWLALRDLYGDLDGVYDSGKVMYGYNSAENVLRTLHADDVAGIMWIYPPGVVPALTLLDAWWTDAVDTDGDGYKRTATLKWDPNVSGGTSSLVAFEKVYIRPAGTTPWSLVAQTNPHVVWGASTSDIQSQVIPGSAHGLYDFRIEVYRNGETAPDAARDPATDTDLANYALELPADDAVTPPPGGAATSDMPATYRAGRVSTVRLDVTPAATTTAWAVQDQPPADWVPSNISGGGQWDAADKMVKWGPFSDATARALTYDVTPPAGETGAKTFAGQATFDGASVAIGGRRTMVQAVTPGDFNTDGAADLVVFRPSTGEWWVRGAVGAGPVFGTPTDLPVVADYNGDGQVDIAVWRPATGEWLIKDQVTVVLGAAGDIPVPGDYNGDGRAEVAVFHARTGVWEFVGLPSVTLGQPGDVPVPGDYNGDAVMEPAVYRRATGTWLFADQTTIGWGGPGDIAVPADYDGDGTTDVAIYRPSTGDWYVRNGVHVAWGAPGDVPVPLDVDGDGRGEIIVYRPATGAWFIYHTESSASETVMWGGAGDVPIGQQPLRSALGVNDLDGDGRSDVTIFRPGTGQWFTLRSGSGFTQWTGAVLGEAGDIPLVGEFMGTRLQQRVAYRPTTGVWRLEDTREIGWGSAGDIPVLGDYDGDGLTDIAVYRPTTGAWFVLTSLSGYTESRVFGWGGEGDVPVPGDYDGDAITDVAVYRPATGTWFVLTSSSAYQQYRIYAWGNAEDVPVVGDYDGDGVSDIAVYRASIGGWYIVTSSSNFMGTLSMAWGGGDDIPVPGDYNGDGFTEVAVYRPATGTWFVMGSAPIEWGATGDVPVK